MKIKVSRSSLQGSISVPASKSHTIRAIAAALMADGVSRIRAPLESADTCSTLEAARLLGARIEQTPECWSITGNGGKLRVPKRPIDMGNSGTGLKIFAALAATASDTVHFCGDGSLSSRPVGSLLDALRLLGVESTSSSGCCPLSVTGPLRGGKTEVDGYSSQFLTALLFACPYARQDTEIRVHNLNEKPYVRITLGWLERLGVKFSFDPELSWFEIEGGQCFKPFDAVMPADFSTAAFPLGAAALAGREVAIGNLDFDDLQGDKAVFDHLERMGAGIVRNNNLATVSAAALHGIDIDLNATPDALPLLSAVAAFAEGTTRLLNVPQARIKETDRIACMTSELKKMGVRVEELQDGMIIHGGQVRGAEVEGHGDHRIVMALAVAGLAADGETVINGAESANVTYPGFVDDFLSLGARIERIL